MNDRKIKFWKLKSSYTALIYRLKKDFEKEMMIEVSQNIEEVQYLLNNFTKQMNSMGKKSGKFMAY